MLPAAALLLSYAVPAAAQAPNRPARFLGREEILLYGIGLKAEPAHQTVPKDIATIVSTYLQAPTLPAGVPPFAPDAVVKATLRGPSFATAQELTVKPNTPFNIPPLTVPGTHTLENIRLVSGGEVLLRGVPEQVTIEVIERLLITQITARPLTAAEIRERGIVFDQSNFQAYNFSAAFAIQDRTVDINFAVVLPQVQGASDVTVGNVSVPGIPPPGLPQLRTLIPDTLKLQTQVPNLSVVGFTLKPPKALEGNNFVVPPIPGVIVIPGDIGFLNQYFSVMLMVGNVAPAGSGLDVSNISAEIVLPPGRDTVVNTADDPLRMAQTTLGESARVQLVVQPGPDGKLGTGDDIGTLHPGESGNAEYLVEGRREGSHVVEMAISATLHGLPVGPVQITGRAAGSVLVRNPRFTLTFTHPENVAAGEPYSLDVTVTNTSDAPANFVQLALYPRNVSGATIVGESTRGIESVAPGDSATVSFDLISRISGKVTAATLDSDDKVAGRFELKASVGELGVPVSPDTLVLPKEAGSLPKELRDAALGLLGKAYAVATAPPAALPPDIRRFSRKIVIDRAVEVAEAGLRRSLREALPDTAAQLLMDFDGSNYARLQALVKPADLAFEQENFTGFDELRRRSLRGDVFARAVAAQLAPALLSNGAPQFHYDLAQKWSYRPGHVSVLVSSIGALPVTLSVVDASGHAVGGAGTDSKVRKEIPYSDLLPFADANGVAVGQMALLATPAPGAYKVRLVQTGTTAPYTLSLVMPAPDGTLRQAVFYVAPGQVPVMQPGPSDPVTFTFELVNGDSAVQGPALLPATNQAVVDPAPSVVSVVQQKDADLIRCDPEDPGTPAGRIVAVLFSEEVTPASVQDRLRAEDITGFRSDGNRIVGVALQPGRRIAFVALRDPIGPFVARQITIDSATDLRGQPMTPFTGPMETTVGTQAGVVSGRVLRADGTPVPFANVRLFYRIECGLEPAWIGIASKSTDAEGRYSWDYVLRAFTDKIVAIDSDTNESRTVPFNIQRDGQRLNADIVFLGRGTFAGTTRSEAGTLLRDTAVRVTSLTDNSQYGATTDANGRFTIPRIPVGNIYVEAVNVAAKAKFSMSEAIPFAGATIERDITLLDIEQRQVTLKLGTVKGHVLRTNGATPAGRVPVFVWYASGSQTGVNCPGDPTPPECAVAGGQTSADGAFSFSDVPAGSLRVSAFDQDGLVQGEARLQLAADATVDLNVILVGGLGTVKGQVLTPDGAPVAGASVGGGLSLVTTNASGEFTLPDVPVGKRDIVAVSDALKMSGRVTIDLTRAGDTINATIVLDAVGSVSGTVVQSDGVTPVSGGAVYVFHSVPGGIEIVGTATTSAQGGYRIDGVRPGEYKVSSFNAGFTDGNIVPAVVKYNHQVFRADIKWRGSGGRVVGTVFDDDGQTPLKATVSLSGDQVQVAGGRVGVAFQHVNHFKLAETDFTTGRYVLNGALVGPVTVSAAGQFSPDPIAVEAVIPSANATVTVNLRLLPTSQIRGVILQPDGLTPAGKDVIVKYKSEAFRVICTTDAFGEDHCDSIPQGVQNETVVTDDNGRFWVPVVNAGAFSISVEDPVTGKTGQIKGSVRAGETAEVSVRLLGLGELSVQVFGSDTTTAIPGAKVVVTQLNFPNKRVEGRADTMGTIVFTGADGFSEGEFTVEATDLRNGFAGRGTARIARDGEQVSARVYLFDAVGSVSGKIFASDGVTPVPNAEIVLSNGAGPIAFSLSNVDGSYRIETVPPGTFRVEAFEARTARRAAGTGRIDLAGQDVPLNLTQASLGVVKGHVLESTALSPLKAWTVTLGQRSSSGLTLGTLQTTSAIDGAFLFPGTSRGTFTLTAARSGVNGSASAGGTIDREGEVVDVPLLVKILRPLTGTISGTVLTASGAPAGNRPIEICHPARSCEAPVQLTADPDGNFSLPDVPLGRFRVTAKSQDTHEAGSVQGELTFDGDIASVRVILGGTSEVRGTVERANGSPAGGVRVELTGQPDPGCAGESCVVFTDGSGAFAFVNVPAKSFTVTAVDPLNPLLKGASGGALNPGQIKDHVRIVLAPSFALSGRVLLTGGRAVQGAVAELVVAADRSIFAEAGADGVFTFAAAPPGTYQLLVSDPVGSGVASRTVSIAADVSLGDIVLDTAAPFVAASAPAPAAVGVARHLPITVTFSEPIRPATVNPANLALTGPSGAVTATLDVSANDSVVTLTPLTPLADQTRYTLRVRGVEDRFGKAMAADYVAVFTTVDIKAATIVDASPAPDTGGAPISTPVRIAFSETIDPSAFTGAPIAVTGPAGAVAGRTDYLFGNTVIVFTPNVPLAEDAAYAVTVQRATDLSGNRQAAALTYQFSTSDRTPPQVQALVAGNGGNVVEDGVAAVTADVGASHDVAVIDFYINDVLAFADRTAPFELSFRAVPALYGPAGSKIKVSAIATDTSGNRGDARSTELSVTADQAPTVAILSPADGLSAHNGDRIVVRVKATDDLGVAKIGYRAQTGNPGDALTRTLSPAPVTSTEDFVFFVPETAAPGTTLIVSASASDTKAQVAQASIAISVLDSTPPTVTITGATSGARVLPGQQTTVVVTAQDIGRIASVKFTASGIVTATETRPVDPAQPSIVTSFTVTVPTTARAGQTLTLGAIATDVAGNSTSAAQVVLPVADTTPPTVTLAPENSSFTAVPGQPVSVVVTAEDEIGVSRIDVKATGAATFDDAKQVSPPIGSATKTFSIPVPPTAQPGSQIQVTATASDLANNTSGPASLTLTVISPVDVTLPPSAIVAAGESIDVAVQISAAAPAGGTRIDFTTTDPNVATVPAFLVVPEGQTATTLTVSAVAGGTAQVRAVLGGVQRASMTATVNGGIVTGLVRDAQLNPIAGAQLTVSGGGTAQNVVTDNQGRYRIDGVAGPDVDVRALDPVTRLYGHATGTMARPYGYASVNVVLIPAAAIHGRVSDATGAIAGGGVRVDIYAANSTDALATTFTADDGTYAFPLATLGEYRIEATALDGRRGRTTVMLDVTGRDATVNIVYLGTGTVTGTVRIGSTAVPNAELTFTSSSIFGAATPIVTSAQSDGTFAFASVPLGTFTVIARDPVTQQAGSTGGTIAQHGQTVHADVQLTSYGAIEGRVLQSDGVTPVAGAVVRLDVFRNTRTDELGRYRFDIVPLARHTVDATDEGTRGYASATTDVVAQGATSRLDLVFLGQGRVVVSVADAGGTPVADAFVVVQATAPGHVDTLSGRTGPDGSLLIEHVTAGSLTVSASYGVQRGSGTATLATGELKPIAIQLSPTGSLAGTVYQPDGQTPAAGARVAIARSGVSVLTDADGTFRIDGQLLGRYDLAVRDAAGRLRALTSETITADDLVIESNGAVATRDFTFIGLGTVTGRVITPAGASAQNMGVELSYGGAGFAGSAGARTDGGGFFTFQNVPVGMVTVVASDLGQQLYGERTGEVERHNQTVTIDISLTSNATTLPAALFDANNLYYDVQRSGALSDGDASLWSGDFNTQRGAMLLDVTSGGVTTRFSGPEVPTVEDGGREIAVRQENLAGLSVTRKVFVPRGGYFARYLEIFRNPTAAPITIDADVTGYPSGRNARLFRTSSGDTIFDVLNVTPDNWLVTARDFDTMSSALVFQGAGAALPAGASSFQRLGGVFGDFSRASYGWRGITIAPGETVALMHFGVQQLSTAAALASVQRLVQLPPEALTGLSQEEIGAVRNFAVPAGGASAVAPLPALTGTITGRVLEYNRAVAVPNATVSFTSDLALFSRRLSVAANAEGQFTLTGALNDFASSFPIPETGFTLQATHSQSSVQSPVVAGQFDAPGLTAVKDIAFTNASVVSGTVRRHNGAAIAQNGTVSMSGSGLANGLFSVIASDSSYSMGGVPAGDFLVTTQVPHPQGSSLSVSLPLHVDAGRSVDLPIALPATGTVTGTVRTASGLGAANIAVGLTQGSNFNRATTTDSGGHYTLTDVPAGPVQVVATEPRTQFVTTGTTTVVQDLSATVDLTLVAVASVRVDVRLANGQPAAGSFVRVEFPVPTGVASRTGTTNALGVVTLDGVSAGTFTATAGHPGNSQLTASVTDTVTSDATVPVTITLPAAGSVTVTVTRGANVVVNNSGVRLSQPGRGDRTGSTNSQGAVTFTGVAAGPFTVSANHPENRNLSAVATGTLASENESVPVSVALPPIGTVTGVVRTPQNQPMAGAPVSLRTASGAIAPLSATTNTQGQYTIAGVPAGPFTVTVESVTLGVFGTANGTITTDLQTVTVNIALQTNIVQLPKTLNDGNGFTWDIQGDGDINNGTSDAYDGGLYLRLYDRTGANSQFAWTSSGLSEDGAREITMRQLGFFGLNVTRKIFVPADGYFARFLEELTNPTTVPITVDLGIETNLGSDSGTNLIATSSGDRTFAADDRWLVTDDTDGSNDPTMAHVMAGPGATLPLSAASIFRDAIEYRWNAITIQPGQTVTLMHFAVQQNNQARSQASAERLAQLPGEALEGLSADEIASIANFSVPTDGSNPPAMHRPGTGTVSVRVVGGDGVTPVNRPIVKVRSAHPIYDLSGGGQASTDGRITIANVLIAPFTSDVRDQASGITAPAMTGEFAAGQTTATLDVPFSNAGTIRGSVRRASGAATSASGFIDAPVSGSIEAGAYVLPVVPPGLRTVTGAIQYLDQYLGYPGIPLSAPAQVTAGLSTQVDLVVPALGAIAGTVRTSAGEPIANLTVSLFALDVPAGTREATTDAQGHYLFLSVSPGGYLVSAYNPVNGVPTYVIADATADQETPADITFPRVGSVTAALRYPDGSPVVNALVQITDADTYSRSGQTNAAGDYVFTNAPVDTGLTLTGHLPGFDYNVTRTDAVRLNVNGDPRTLTLAMPALATLRVYVKDAAGAVLPNFSVYSRPFFQFYDNYAGSTNAEGYVDVRMPQGTSSVVAFIGGDEIRWNGEIASADHGRTIEITLRQRIPGTVTGTVRAGDGVTPLRDAYVEVFDGNNYYTGTYADEAGHYQIGPTPLPALGFTVRAWSPGNQVFASVQAAISQPDETVTVNLTVPVVILDGTVTAYDGTPIPYPDVFVTTDVAAGGGETYYAFDVDENGHYRTYLPAGQFTVMARSAAGLQVSRPLTIPDVTQMARLDLQMPPTGTVTGTFRDANGQAIPWRELQLFSAGLDGALSLQADGNGFFSRDGVPLGPFSIEGCDYQDNGLSCETAAGVLGTPGQAVRVDVRLPRTGSLNITIVDANGLAPAWSEVFGTGITRRSEIGWQYTQTGTVTIADVPEGTHLLVANGPGARGIAEATVIAGRTTEARIQLGNATGFTANLIGADEFRYDVRCEGRLSDGGGGTHGFDAYDSAYYLRVSGRDFPCVAAARLLQNGRELLLGPARPGIDGGGEGGFGSAPPFEATRRIFSPEAGGFVRYFDQVTNRTGATQTVTLDIRGNYGPFAESTAIAVAPSATANTYAVMRDLSLPSSETRPAPTIATVFAGANAPTPPARVYFRDGDDNFTYGWTITLAPGQSAAILHFGVQRDNGDVAAAQAQAEALATLTDPSALEGLSAADRALIVNFAGQGAGAGSSLHGTIEGRVVAADGATPVAGAVVYAIDVASNRVVANVTADTAGVFRFGDLYATASGIKLLAAYGAQASNTAEALVTFTAAGDAVTGVTLAMPVSVLSGTVRRPGTGEPVPGAMVLAAPSGGSPATYRAALFGGGRYGFVDLPPGEYVVTATDGSTGASVAATTTIPASSPVVSGFDLEVAPAAVCAPPAPALAGWWAGESDALDSVHHGGDGTANATVTFAPGKVGQAFAFDGAAAAVTLPLSARLESPFSIEAWVMPRKNVTPDGPLQWIARRATPDGGLDLGIVQSADFVDGTQRFAFVVGAGGYPRWAESSRPIELGRLYHLVATYDGVQVRLYIDGELDGTGEAPGSRAVHDAPLTLGLAPGDGAPACDCVIDEVKIYERALGGADVQSAFASASAGTCSADLAIVTTSVPASFEGQPYSARVRAAGGSAPVTFAVTSGSPAPGLALTPEGSLDGTPTAAGSYTFTVTATDGAGHTKDVTLTQACGTCLGSPAGAIAFWSANGNAEDRRGGNDGYLENVGFVPGIDQDAFAFGGFGTMYPITPASEVNSTFTIEFWARPTSERGVTGESNDGISGTDGRQRYAIAPEYRGIDGQANVGVSVGTNGISVFEHGPNYLPSLIVYDAPVADWTHVAVVYRNNQPFLYVNGVLVREGLASARTVYLSKRFGDFAGYGRYQGLLDEIGMYDRALTPAEIAAIAASSVRARCPAR